jgi:hypothetical protein
LYTKGLEQQMAVLGVLAANLIPFSGKAPLTASSGGTDHPGHGNSPAADEDDGQDACTCTVTGTDAVQYASVPVTVQVQAS